jgi:hypothetical protein
LLSNGPVLVSPIRLETHKSSKRVSEEQRNHQLDSVTNDIVTEKEHTRQDNVTNDVSGEEHLNRPWESFSPLNMS